MSKIIGIDLGTTNSCVAVLEGGTPTVIVNAEGQRTTPSVVAIKDNGEKLVGEPAKRQAVTNVDRTFASVKRNIGTDKVYKVGKKDILPQDISAVILKKLKDDAESYLGERVTKAVITVPAYFNDKQRQATKDAGRIAGLEVERIVNEPTAAALSYGLDMNTSQKVMIFDLGGGTFDVSIIELGDGVVEVIAVSGDNHLGGDDFDKALTDYIVSEFKRAERIDLSKDQVAMQRVLEAAEKAKIELSSLSVAKINLPFIATDKTGPKHLDIEITRKTFNELTYKLVDRTSKPVSQALHDSNLRFSDIDKIILVGGSTRIPAVQEKIEKLSGITPSRNLNPDECVALGAAIQGGKLAGEPGLNSVLLMDVTPHSLSVETLGGVSTVLISKNSTIPTRYSQIFTTAGNFQTSVDIRVFQGEGYYTKDNKCIGNFRLSGIKRAMRGVPQIEVSFDIDANGILNVSARDLGTGKSQAITIVS